MDLNIVWQVLAIIIVVLFFLNWGYSLGVTTRQTRKYYKDTKMESIKLKSENEKLKITLNDVNSIAEQLILDIKYFREELPSDEDLKKKKIEGMFLPGMMNEFMESVVTLYDASKMYNQDLKRINDSESYNK